MVVIKVTFYFMGTFNSSVMEKWRREREILSKLTSAGCLDLYRVCRWEALLGHTDLSLWLRGNDHNTKSTYVRKVCAYHCTLKWMLTIARWNLEHILKWSQYNEGKWATLNTGQLGWDGGSRYRFLLCHGPLRFLSKQDILALICLVVIPYPLRAVWGCWSLWWRRKHSTPWPFNLPSLIA